MTETNRKKRGRKPNLLLDISNNGLNAAPLMNRVSKEEYDNADPWLEKNSNEQTGRPIVCSLPLQQRHKRHDTIQKF